MKLLIAGTPSFKDKLYIEQHISKLLKSVNDRNEKVTLLYPLNTGVADFATQYAVDKKYVTKEYFPDWEKYGKRAGIVCNSKMAGDCTHAVVFWDGVSEETKYLIDTLKESNINLIIYKIKTKEIKNEGS